MYGVDSEDGLTFDGATQLASRVRAYWKKRGLDVEVWVDKQDGQYGEFLFCVRSDLFRGKPR